MTVHPFTSNSPVSGPVIVFAANDTWIVEPGALAAATSDVAVESPQFSDASTLDNFGHILSTFGTGVVFSSNTGVIRNEAAASIEGLDTAIAVSGLGTTITNYGTVDCLTAVSASLAGFGIFWTSASALNVLNNYGRVFGVRAGVDVLCTADGGQINNSGIIDASGMTGWAGDGVLIEKASGPATNIANAAGGVIHGPGNGIETSSGGTVHLTNSGLVSGDTGIALGNTTGGVSTVVNKGTIQTTSGNYAILTSNGGAVSLTNTGKIQGSIGCFATGAADVVVNHGKIVGNVFLGGGNDVFLGQGGNAVRVYGDDGNDRLVGGKLADVLAGGDGNDTLTGGGGRDHFVFDTPPNSATNFDRITDFAPGIDKISLQSSTYLGLGGLGTLAAARFHVGPAPHAAGDRIIYNPANGFLFYDQDGSGHGHAPIHFATLAAHLTLHNTDFLVSA